jgi:HSP20 family molecular chaperone IbpA
MKNKGKASKVITEAPANRTLKFEAKITFEVDQQQLQNAIEAFTSQDKAPEENKTVFPISLIINTSEQAIVVVEFPGTNEPGRITTTSGGAR